MPRTPDDDLWDNVIEQMDDALEALGLTGDARDTLTDSVVEALRAMVTPASDPPDEASPRVVVLDGGRSDARTDGGSERADTRGPDRRRPPLHVADDTDADDVTVHVYTVEDPELDDDPLALGRIRLDDGWQTLFRGDAPRPYRLACRRGRLEVAVDGEVVEQLSPGQTMDVEGRLVRVRSGDDGGARGSYVRLDGF